jgi:hypothetical protein
MPEEIEVPTEHLHEKMEEEAEEAGAEHKWISRVAVSSAILAVLAAITALLASHHSDEAILEQMRANDEWSYYQAKGIKLAILESTIEQLTADGKPVAAARTTKVEQYTEEMKEIKEKGDALTEASEDHEHHHFWLARGVTAFQIAIAMGAIAVLARRPALWFVSLGLGLLGILSLILGLL